MRPLLLRPSVASTLAKAHLPLLLDLVWIRVLIGGDGPPSVEDNARLAEYGEFLTELDPRFFHAYYYISLLLPVATAPDEYANGELAIRLVRKGLKQFPNDIRLRMHLAFLLTYVERDLKGAVQQFVEISKLENAPPVAIASATAQLIEEGRFDEAYRLLDEGIERNPTTKVLRDRRKQLRIEQELRELDAALDRAEQKTGRRPQRLDELIAAGEWPAERRRDVEGGELEVRDGKGYSSWLVGRLRGLPEW
jgi:tetratricopeptide (TPR) repeat protein